MSRPGRFRRPPAADPVGALRSSISNRLNTRLFLRQLGFFLVLDLLLAALLLCGTVFDAENRCAHAAALVRQRGVPSADALLWMEASDYTILPLDRLPQGHRMPAVPFLPQREELRGALRSWIWWEYYQVELTAGGQSCAIRVDLHSAAALERTLGLILLIWQGVVLLSAPMRNSRSIKTALRPIQELAAATARLNEDIRTSRRGLEDLADELDKINAPHLDSRIPAGGGQKELRDLTAAINAMLDRLNAAYSAQARFVSDASHELRTPIAVIQGYAALLDRWGKDDPEALRESIAAIRSEAAAMEELVEQLLFLARGDNDTQPVKCVPLDLLPLAEEVLREEEMICPDRVFLSQWGEQPVVVSADQGLLKQVLRILADNSVKYSAPGSRIWLRVSARDGYARLTVQDEGMGIPPESLPHVFDRFYRTDRSRDRKTGGTGLGLAIALWIVQRHGGWFEVASREGLGTRFTAVLPLAPAQQLPQSDENKESSERPAQ